MGKVMKFIFHDNSSIEQQFVGKTGIKDLQRNARFSLNCHIMSATILKANLRLLYSKRWRKNKPKYAMTDGIRSLLFHTTIVAVKMDDIVNESIYHMLIIWYDKNHHAVMYPIIKNITSNFLLLVTLYFIEYIWQQPQKTAASYHLLFYR